MRVELKEDERKRQRRLEVMETEECGGIEGKGKEDVHK